MKGRHLVLGTAGHIDHGKTALVRALTGVDTDRLQEEKERGITIDLGFAELAGEGVRLGVVDVPGHQGFIRNMLAGATGMDVVLLAIAADEGVMPQTREHLAIVHLLGVRSLVVALTKTDLVEPAWLELVRDEVDETLTTTPYAGASVVPTSAVTGQGLEALAKAVLAAARAGDPRGSTHDLARLPVDRVFTVRGTGTVVTGTLWSGRLEEGQEVAVQPAGLTARIRALQVHGEEVEAARAGQRTAVALAGAGIDRAALGRGDNLLDLPLWTPSYMVTARVELLADTGWSLAHNQRVRVHLGTAETLARVVTLTDAEALGPGEGGWVQLRLEEEAVARAGERFVLRSYSPVTTFGGGVVAEPLAPKRSSLDPATRTALRTLVDGTPRERVAASVELAGWEGVAHDLLPVRTGASPERVREAVAELEGKGGAVVGGVVLGPGTAEAARRRIGEAVDRIHDREPLRLGLPLERARALIPGHAPAEMADRVMEELVGAGELVSRGGVLARPGFEPVLDDEQARLRDRVGDIYREAGLEAPAVSELPDASLVEHPDLWALLRLMEARGELIHVDGEIFAWAPTLRSATASVTRELGGRRGLGPADFRSVLPVSRKHLLPLLAYLDRVGITMRGPEGRDVVGSDSDATVS